MSLRSAPSTLIVAFLDVLRRRPQLRQKAGTPRPIALFALETGGCEGCAMEINALAGSAFSLEGSGFVMVSAPEDADWLLVTGAVTRASAAILDATWRAMPPGRSLVAIGDCAINGGPYGANYAVLGGLEKLATVQQRVPGCPPAPQDILSAFLSFEARLR